MKYTPGRDGRKYASIAVVIRLSPDEIEEIRDHLKAAGESASDKAVKDFVRGYTEYTRPAMLGEEPGL